MKKVRENKPRVYVGFMDLEKVYDRYGFKCRYVYSLACVRVKGDESECFRIDNRVR